VRCEIVWVTVVLKKVTRVWQQRATLRCSYNSLDTALKTQEILRSKYYYQYTIFFTLFLIQGYST